METIILIGLVIIGIGLVIFYERHEDYKLKQRITKEEDTLKKEIAKLNTTELKKINTIIEKIQSKK